MEFDVFDKLSELETRIYHLKEEILQKDVYIKQLVEQNSCFREQLEVKRKCLEVCNADSDLPEPTSTCDKGTSTELMCDTKSDLIEGDKSIADMLKETSESVMQNTGYVFDQQTGLYFDKNSGYYYDPENQLFFEPKSGVYYSYNSETQEYSYHSRVSTDLSEKFKKLIKSRENQLSVRQKKVSPKETVSQSKHKLHRRRRRSYSSSSSVSSSLTWEEGEIGSRHRRLRRRDRRGSSSGSIQRRRHRQRSNKSSSCSVSSPYRSHSRQRHRRRSGDRSRHYESSRRSRSTVKKEDNDVTVVAPTTCVVATPLLYPPSVRLMVLASDRLPVGSVGVITSQEALSGWSCLGRNTLYCPVFNLIDDCDLEEIHCEITFNRSTETYHLKDRKSANGTFLNGKKIDQNEKKSLCHGDVLRIGTNRFLIHIHPGRDTCGQCEAYDVQTAMQGTTRPHLTSNSTLQLNPDSTTQASKETARLSTINELKIKYGLKGNRRRRECAINKSESQYEDRAAKRRAAEKDSNVQQTTRRHIPQASVYTPIDEENKGARMLTKMGWKSGEGLGREKTGIAEPVSVGIRLNPSAGLGSNTRGGINLGITSMDATPADLRQARVLAVTRERYRQLDQHGGT